MMLLKNIKITNFIKREKRFLVHTNLGLVYCANTGRMEGLLEPNTNMIVSNINSKMKLKWEAAFIENTWVGTNTQNPNFLINSILETLFPNDKFQREVMFTTKSNQRYRADFASIVSKKIIEVKHVHWKRFHDKNNQTAYFPDCITDRGARQIIALNELGEENDCYLIYVVQRNDVNAVTLADDIDKVYTNAIRNSKNIKFLAFNSSIILDSQNKNVEIKINTQIEYIFI